MLDYFVKKYNLNITSMIRNGTVAVITMAGVGVLFGVKNIMIAFPIALTSTVIGRQNFYVKPLSRIGRILLLDLFIVLVAFISSLKEEGKDFVELDGKINVNNDWSKEFMQFFRDKTQSGAFRVPGEDKFLSGPFSNQKLLAYQGSSAGFAHINTNGAFEIAVVEVPHFEGKDKAVIQQGASLFVTNDVSEEAQYAAYEFIKFATNTENTAKFATGTGYLPVRKSALDSSIVQDVLADTTSLYGKIYYVANTSLNYAYFTPAVNNAQSARTVAEEKYASYVTGTSDDVEAMLKEMNSQVETSISRQ